MSKYLSTKIMASRAPNVVYPIDGSQPLTIAGNVSPENANKKNESPRVVRDYDDDFINSPRKILIYNSKKNDIGP